MHCWHQTALFSHKILIIKHQTWYFSLTCVAPLKRWSMFQPLLPRLDKLIWHTFCKDVDLPLPSMLCKHNSITTKWVVFKNLCQVLILTLHTICLHPWATKMNRFEWRFSDYFAFLTQWLTRFHCNPNFLLVNANIVVDGEFSLTISPCILVTVWKLCASLQHNPKGQSIIEWNMQQQIKSDKSNKDGGFAWMNSQQFPETLPKHKANNYRHLIYTLWEGSMNTK